jgi:hypothetical protein
MKKILYFLILLLSYSIPENCKAQEDNENSEWEFSADGYSYFFTDDFLFLPVIRADKDKLHFEARYNYENTETFSGWFGYNINGGNKIDYSITPMVGIIAGNTNGIAPGLEATIGIGKFEFYTEAEYVFDFESSDDNYFYNWADLSFTLKDWLWFGLSGQRIRSYNSELEYQRGILVGGGGEKWELNGYAFNIDTDDPFYVLGVSFFF